MKHSIRIENSDIKTWQLSAQSVVLCLQDKIYSINYFQLRFMLRISLLDGLVQYHEGPDLKIWDSVLN